MLLVGCYFDWMFLVFAIFALAVFALADLSFAEGVGDEIELRWEPQNSNQASLSSSDSSVQLCPSPITSSASIAFTSPVELASSGQIMLSFNVQSKLQAPPLKIRYKISPPPEHTFNQNCASPLFSATGSPSSSATGRSQLSLDFQEFDWASQPQPAPKKGDNFLMVNLPCDENIFVLEVSLEVTRPLLDSASQSSCVTIEQPTFSLSTACKPKYFRDRLTFLRQTFGEGFRSEECIANAQSKYIRGDMSGKFGFLTSSTTVDKLQYQCIRKFSLMEFEFYPVEQGSSEVKLPESSRVPSCVCIAGYEVSEDSEGIVTCRPCGPNSFKSSVARDSCAFCPPNSKPWTNRRGCECKEGFFPNYPSSAALAPGEIESCEELPKPVRQLSWQKSGSVVFLYWRPPQNLVTASQQKATSYSIEVLNSTSAVSVANYSAIFQSLLLDSLNPGEKYRVRVRANYKGRQGEETTIEVATSQPWTFNFTKQDSSSGQKSGSGGYVVLSWRKQPALSLKHFHHYNIQVLPRQLASRKSGRVGGLLVVLDAEVVANQYSFNADHIKPIYGSYWDQQQAKYVEYSPMSTDYCVRVGIVEQFSNPFISPSSSSAAEDGSMFYLHTHWSEKCEPVVIGGFVFAKVILWSCVFVLFVIVLLLCLVVGCCFVKYKRRQFEALYPHPLPHAAHSTHHLNLNSHYPMHQASAYQGSEYIVANGQYQAHPLTLNDNGGTYMPVGGAGCGGSPFWGGGSPPTPSAEMLYHPANAILPHSARHAMGMDNDIYEALNQHKYNMSLGHHDVGQLAGHKGSLEVNRGQGQMSLNGVMNTDEIYKMEKDFSSMDNILNLSNYQCGKVGSGISESSDQGEYHHKASLTNKGRGHAGVKSKHKPPLPVRCPNGEALPNAHSTISSNNSTDSPKLSDDRPYTTLDQNCEHLSQSQSRLDSTNQRTVPVSNQHFVPIRPTRVPPPPQMSVQSIYEDLDTSKKAIFTSQDT